MFELNKMYFFKLEGQIVEGKYKGKNGKMYLSKITGSLEECHLLEVSKEMLRIAESDLRRAFYDTEDEIIEGLPF